MTMNETKKLIRATLAAYKRCLDEHIADGWKIESEEQLQRPRNRKTYIATLYRE